MSIHGKMIKKILLTLLIMSSVLCAASVKLRLSSTEVVEGNALDVQIIAEGKDIEFPEIRDIGGFPVERNGISNKLESSYINGKFSSKSVKILRFTLYPEVDMTIPAFKVKIGGKRYETNPVKIRVVKASSVKAKGVDGYTLRIKASKKHVYVGEPFIVTVDFFEPRSSRVSKVEYTPPQFKGFFSQLLGEEKLKRTGAGTMHELQYLVSAKKEGNLTIIPPKARVGIRSLDGTSGDPWGLFANDIRWHSVRANALSVKVKAVPGDIDLIGLFKVETSVDHKTVQPNRPVTYTLKISGEGSLDDMADPKFDIPGVTIYGDDAKVTNRVKGDKLISQYERKYVFISDSDFVIPSLTFKSFDYLSQKSKRLTTKAYKIKVNGNGANPVPKVVTTPKTGSDTATVNMENLQEKKLEQNKSILEDTVYYKAKEKRERAGYPLWTVFVAFLLGVVATILGIKLYRIVKQKKGSAKLRYYSEKEALKILYPHTNHDKKVEAMVRKLYERENGNKDISIDKEELANMIAALQDSV